MLIQLRRKIIASERTQRFLVCVARLIARYGYVDLLEIAYSIKGIHNYQSDDLSGESHVLKQWLPSYFGDRKGSELTFLDVGANVGDYSTSLSSQFASCRIFSFEPNPETFKSLLGGIESQPHIQAFNLAVGDSESAISLWTRHSADASQHASMYAEVLSDQHKYNDLVSVDVDQVTLDAFCLKHSIDRIDFLKIDVEGHEMSVLKGAKSLLAAGNIEVIQFEFNEMNLISRVFLRDFFDLLQDSFTLYRLLPDRLDEIEYSSTEEIFLFQNFLAVKKKQVT